MYNSSANRLNAKDTVRAYLRNVNSPYNIADSSKAVIDSLNFTGNFKFNFASAGQYYIVVKHRNSIETWSRINGENYNPMNFGKYNFTDSLSKAYSGNMIQADNSPLRYGIYSGDINQDGVIDAADVSSVDNDATGILTGYRATDLTGDRIVDVSDLSIADNNSNNSVSVIRP